MKNLKIKLICDASAKKSIRDDYGWEIPSSKAIEAFDEVRNILGDTDLLLQLSDALSYQELADCLAVICRMNDLKIPQLDNRAIEDALLEPFDDQEDEKKYTEKNIGQERISRMVGRYRGFIIMLTKKNKYDIYDSSFHIRAADYPSVEACKEDIDKAIEGIFGKGHYGDDEKKKPVKTEEGPTTSEEPGPKTLSVAGVKFERQSDGSYVTKHGEQANRAGSTGGKVFPTFKAAVDEMIKIGKLEPKKIRSDYGDRNYAKLSEFYKVETVKDVKPKSIRYKGYFIVPDPAGDGLNIFNKKGELEDEGYNSVKDCKEAIDEFLTDKD